MPSGSNVTPFALTGTTGQVISSAPSGATDLPPAIFYGFAVAETGGFPVQVELRDGTSGGALLGVSRLAGNGYGPAAWFGPQGVKVPSGKVFVVVTGTGTLEGSVFLG